MTKFIQQLDALESDEDLLINREVLGDFQQNITYASLVLGKKSRNIGFCEPPGVKLPFETEHHLYGVDWYGYKSTFRDLGLAMFSLLFSHENYLAIKLSHPVSAIKILYIYFEKEQVEPSFLRVENQVSYKSYEYFRQMVDKFPFSSAALSGRSLLPIDLPGLNYGWGKNRNYNLSYNEQLQQANQVIVNISAGGLCALGSLFLDISASNSEQNEVCLESPSLGFGGVQENSLETRFWLPGSFGFYCDSLDDLILSHNHPHYPRKNI